jgi:hypothetical protein
MLSHLIHVAQSTAAILEVIVSLVVGLFRLL